MRVQHTQDIRGGERRQFRGNFKISWQTRSGEMKTLGAKCLDLSDLGARVECDSPIDFLTNVYLQAPAYGLMGNATVRYCRRSGIRYMIGLLFSSVASQADQGRKRILVQSQPGAEK
ncbi:MAG TPA: hypothetical protein VN924_06825 [Bryobacteraceae bacterium]|nr:hypothetical protein [Bryobacteraceae bacterium]